MEGEPWHYLLGVAAMSHMGVLHPSIKARYPTAAALPYGMYFFKGAINLEA